MLDHGADVNKVDDAGVTALSMTLGLLYSDGPVIRRLEFTPPAPVPPEGPPLAAEDSTVGRLNVTRVGREEVNNLLNDVPLPRPTVYFDSAGQVQTLREDAKATEDKRPAAGQQKQQLLKPPTAGGRFSPTLSSKGSSATSQRSTVAVISDDEEQR